MNRVLARTFAVRAQKSKVTHVILSDGVENVGAKGEHLAVKKGFARNFLFKRQVAVYNTPDTARQFAEHTAAIDAVARDQLKSRDRIRTRVSRATLLMKRHVTNPLTGALHAPVLPENIADKLLKQTGVAVTPADVLLRQPLTSIGPHVVPVLIGDAAVDLKVRIDKR
jgi:large subunit ribosomal protein L9